MGKWEMVRLGDVCDVRDGTHDSPKYVNDGYPLVTSKNVIDGRVDFSNVNYISKEDFDKINQRSKVEVADIIMPMIGTIGKPVIVNIDTAFAIKNVALIKFSKDNVSNIFIRYLLDSFLFKCYVEQENRGGTQKFISLGNIRNFPFSLPPLDEQKRIAKNLDLASEIVKGYKEQLAELDKLVQSVFYEMFGDPVTNEKGWENGTIRDVVREVKYGTSRPATEGGKYAYLRMNNVTSSGHLDLSNLKQIDIPDNELEKCVATYGDVLFNRTNSKELVGKTCVYNLHTQMIIAGYIIRVRVNEKMIPEFLSAILNSRYGKNTLYGISKSIIGQANINAQELQNIKVFIPPIQLQTRFASIVTDIEAQKAQVQQALTEAENLFNSLMQEYFE